MIATSAGWISNAWVPSLKGAKASALTRRWIVAATVLLLVYFVTGVFGRFPWKADEPYSFGMVWEMLDEHQWLIPHIAGQPFVEKPPLVYWLGAIFASALTGLPPHESSRAAVLLLVATLAFALLGAARRLHGEVPDWVVAVRSASHTERQQVLDPTSGKVIYSMVALLLIAGTLGFTEHIHKLIADIGQLAGATLALWGLVHVATRENEASDAFHGLRNAVIGGVLLGSGAGIAFMSKGLFIPCVLFLTFLLCLTLPTFRRRRIGLLVVVAIVAALPWMSVWPLLLYRASPDLFDEWMWTHNIGRFLGHVALGGNNRSIADKGISVLAAGFPVLLLTLSVALRTWIATRVPREAHRWKALSAAPGHMCVGFYLFTCLGALAISASMRDVYLLPALPSMILLGLPALVVVREPRTTATKLIVDVLFGSAAAIVAAVSLCLTLYGNLNALPWVARPISRILPLPFYLPPRWTAALAAIAVALLWLWMARRDPLRSATVSWCSGVAMLWTVSTLLLLPWIDAAMSYQDVFGQVAPRVSTSNHCVATFNLGESELAMLTYVTGAKFTRMHLGHSGSGDPSRPNPAASKCDVLLVRSSRSAKPLFLDPAIWTKVWTGARPAESNERFVLYRRESSS